MALSKKIPANTQVVDQTTFKINPQWDNFFRTFANSTLALNATTTGIVAQVSATATENRIFQLGTGLSGSSLDGVAGNPTINLHVSLQSIAGLTTAANKMIYTTASNAYAVTDLSSFGRTLIDDANAAAALTTLGAAATVHTHAQSDITNLTTDLAAKASTSTTVSAAGIATGGGDLSTNRTITVTAATQSDMETASSTSVAVVPGVVRHNPGVAKAWLTLTYSTGTPSATTSLNVSSITDSAGGDGIVNFSTAFSSSNFVAVATNQTSAARNGIYTERTSGSSSRFVINGGFDDNLSLAYFGDQ